MGEQTWKRLFAFDRRQRSEIEGRLAGVDEAGRGPLAGPVVAAAVVFLRDKPVRGLDDSKRLSAPAREKLFLQIARIAMIGVGVVPETVIDNINIYQATRMAMRQAVLALPCTPGRILIDGPLRLDLPLEQKPMIGGDGCSASIAAASVIAKVYRDAWMRHLDGLYPDYGFARHKGYGTPGHLECLRRFGPSPVHRSSFSPVRCGQDFSESGGFEENVGDEVVLNENTD